jgi:hypothetical protein
MEIWDYASLILAFGAIIWLGWFVLKPNTDRADEDVARRFYDEHGHWPDQDPAEANRRYEL